MYQFKFMVYKFTAHCIVYTKLLIVTYKFTANCWYLQVTDQSLSYYTFALLTVCFSTNQTAITLFHVDNLFFNQSESYYTFSLLLSY